MPFAKHFLICAVITFFASQLIAQRVVDEDSLTLNMEMSGGTLAYLGKETLPFTGIAVYRYPNSNLLSETPYFNGKVCGITKNWFPNNIIKSIQNFDSLGIENGFYFEWFENEVLKICGQFKNGNKDGTWIYFSNSGSIIKEEHFSNDIKTGTWKFWNEYGERTNTINFDQ